MCDQKRKRLLTYDDMDNQNIIPRAPLIKPLKDSSILIPELQLAYETPNCFKNLPLTIIPEDVKLEGFQIPSVGKHIKKRQRFQSENLRPTVISMMERQLLNRNSSKLQIESHRY
ncbi:unnamed protein product (macronuclear) [Paramecium tetraurelia]|uniref:Uncharacterized protein n=1 Tax=Paramecium tetraurelia TaxID=5888 RepID=A0CUI0_PARTE|nr:uncharacterized protein GSPATT00010647001 [Paramecium tetraurelia]CAK74447.1 unnamed protein product [Paramecium tetraurelia]|eukprot:XP_001441844.1 hypothetical protein (macronuclear) [Paramecium tetraurelia strain d4-2]